LIHFPGQAAADLDPAPVESFPAVQLGAAEVQITGDVRVTHPHLTGGAEALVGQHVTGRDEAREVECEAVLVVEQPTRAHQLAADCCPGEPDLAHGPETLVQVDGALGGHPVREQGIAAGSDERPGAAVQLALNLGTSEAHRALGAEPVVEEHVTAAAQAVTVERIRTTPVVLEFALGGVELAADLGVVEPDLTAGGEAMVEIDVLGYDPLRIQRPAAWIAEGTLGAAQLADDVRADQPHRGGGVKAAVQVHAAGSAQRIRVQRIGGGAREVAAGRPQPANPGPLQTNLPIGTKAVLQQDVPANNDVVGVDAVARRVAEAGVRAVELAFDARRTQADFTPGVEILAVQEERAAHPEVIAADRLPAPRRQLAARELHVTAHPGRLQGDEPGGRNIPDGEVGLAGEMVGENRVDMAAVPLDGLVCPCPRQVHPVLEHAAGEMQCVRKMGAGQVEMATHAAAGHPEAVLDRPLRTCTGAQGAQHFGADYWLLTVPVPAQFGLRILGSRSDQLCLRRCRR